MSFDPLIEVARDMKKKMTKIQKDPPAICITDQNAEVMYMDDLLLERLDYIKEYVKTNFNLIEEGQYSFPISGTLLGFFKMSSNVMFILYGASEESAKIGKLLLFRGLLENYNQIIEELNADMKYIQDVEKNANLIVTLRTKPDFVAPTFVEKLTPATGGATPAKRLEIGGVLPTTIDAETPIPTVAPGAAQEFPELLEKYRNKKFNFVEGLVMQYCDGQTTVEDVISKSKQSKEDVMEVLETYEKKGWIIMHRKTGGKTLDKLIDVISTSTEALTSKVEAKEEAAPVSVEDAAVKAPGEIYPVLLEKFRNKKFNFKEGIILQYCVGNLTLEEVIAKSKFPEAEVREIISHYQKKEWLIIRS